MKDINHLIEEVGMGRYQTMQLFMIGGLLVLDGAEILLSSSILAALEEDWGLTQKMRGFMMSAIFVGIFCGNLIGGSLADSYGRRGVIIWSYVLGLIFGLLSAMAPGQWSLLFGRFFFGCSFGLGISPGVSLMVESAPASWRGHVMNLGGIFFSFGEIFAAVLLIWFMPEIKGAEAAHHWRYVAALGIAPGAFLFPMVALFLKESPHFLSVKGRYVEAVAILRYMAITNGVENEVRDLLEAAQAEAARAEEEAGQQQQQQAAPTAAGSSGQEGEGGACAGTGEAVDGCSPVPLVSAAGTRKAEGTLRQRVALLMTSDLRSIVVGGAYLCFLSNLLFYGLTYALPIIFSSIHVPFSAAFQVLIVSICDLPGTLLAFFLLYSKDIGHRDGLTALALTGAVAMMTLVTLDFGSEYIWVALPSTYLAKYVSSAFFTLTYIYLAEVFPSHCRATALAVCMSVGRLGSIFAPVLFEATTSEDAHGKFMALASGLCILGVVAIKLLLHFELKNAPLEEEAAQPAKEKAAPPAQG